MDQFRTIIPAPEFPFSISHQNAVVMLGSCFSDNIGARLAANKIETHINPFGILFNPFSIMNAIERMLNNRPYQKEELIQFGEHWISLDHHGRFNSQESNKTLDAINGALERGRDKLMKSDVVIITLGSAWVYRHLERDHIVANCHKIPAAQFKKELLSFQDCHLILRHIPQFLVAHGIMAHVVFTVSPIRHWKDGPIQNQRSKALLLSAIHEVVDEFDSCHYFPGYELMMDDLRDYRFYGSDMLHPTEQAIDYIWEKFQRSFFNDETRIICQEIRSLVQASDHRPVDPESNSFQRFTKKQLETISLLEKKYPGLDLSKERSHFEAFLL